MSDIGSYFTPIQLFQWYRGFKYNELKNLPKNRIKWWASPEGLEYDPIKHYQVVLWVLNEEYIHWGQHGFEDKDEYIERMKERIRHLTHLFLK